MQNPFSHLYEACNTGDPADKWRNLPDFPRIIDVEPSGVCNFKCLFCPTGLGIVTRPQGFMAWDTWTAIVDQCREHDTAIRMIGWGEGTLNPLIYDMVDYARGLLTHLNTNASVIEPDRLGALSSIKYSFQGVSRETYLAARRVDFFDGMIEAIKASRHIPFLSASTSVTDETPEEIEAFRLLMEPLVDHLSIGRTTFDFLDASTRPIHERDRAAFELFRDAETVEKRHPDPCPEVFDKLSISWDGAVQVCCNSWDNQGKIANIQDMSLAEIWRHPIIEAYRERLARREYSGPLCEGCWDYAGLTEV